MFRLGSRYNIPRRTPTNYGNRTQGNHEDAGPVSPTSTMTVPDPMQLQRPFSPWDSTDSQFSISPRNSARAQTRRGFKNRRAHSPTASISTSTTGTVYSIMTISSRSFLGRQRKQVSALNDEFDPTTFRKNQIRPSVGARGQDAAYHEYDDLFEDDEEEVVVEEKEKLEDEASEDAEGDFADDHADGEHNEVDDGFLLLQVKGHLEHEMQPKTKQPAPRARGISELPSDTPEGASDMWIFPSPPSRAWGPVTTTTPPCSKAPSVNEPLEYPTTTLYTPPTPPPKPVPLLLEHLLQPKAVGQNGDTSAEEGDPRRTPPAVPDQVQGATGEPPVEGMKRQASIDGLGIIDIPSPTLFSTAQSSPSNWMIDVQDNRQQQAVEDYFALKQWPSKGSTVTNHGAAALHGEDGKQREPGGSSHLAPPAPLAIRNNSNTRSAVFQSGTVRNNLEVDVERSNASYNSDERKPTVATTVIGGMAPESEGEVGVRKTAAGARSASIVSTNTGSVVSAVGDAKDVSPGVGHEICANRPAAPKGENTSMAEETTEAGNRTSTNGPQGDKNEQGPVASPGDQGKPDSSYLRAFRTFIKVSGDDDAFISRLTRFEALQAHRICANLRKDYSLQATPKKRRATKMKKSSHVKTREAGEEIMTSLWALMATRWLNNGQIIIGPAHHQLQSGTLKRRGTTDSAATMRSEIVSPRSAGGRTSRGGSDKPERRRVLDLGGMPIADWGWHCAVDYPKSKVYTVTQRPSKFSISPTTIMTPLTPETPATSNPSFRGPRNHRHFPVDHLYRLPFPDNHFDAVSARTLWLILRTSAPTKSASQLCDEYERVLTECIRVLKPGGYLEFMLFDSDIINAGPLASEMCLRFSISLEGKGHDPEPTRRWISRLYNAGFTDVQRSWLFLPLAPPELKPKVPSKDYDHIPPPSAVHGSQDLEKIKESVRMRMRAWGDAGVEKGTVSDVAAVAGVLSGGSWEKWLAVAGLGDDEAVVGNIIEEAKRMGSGLRCLIGWARKPASPI